MPEAILKMRNGTVAILQRLLGDPLLEGRRGGSEVYGLQLEDILLHGGLSQMSWPAAPQTPAPGLGAELEEPTAKSGWPLP